MCNVLIIRAEQKILFLFYFLFFWRSGLSPVSTLPPHCYGSKREKIKKKERKNALPNVLFPNQSTVMTKKKERKKNNSRDLIVQNVQRPNYLCSM